MMIHMLHGPALLERFVLSANATLAGDGEAFLALSPLLLGLVGIGLASLLILGGLWLKGRHRTDELSLDLSSALPHMVAAYDHVTGLPTRRLFGTLLDHAIGHAAKTGRSLALLVVELEHFQMVAESQGQAKSNICSCASRPPG